MSAPVFLPGGHRHGKHRLSRTPEYRAWQQMRLRCHDPKHAVYERALTTPVRRKRSRRQAEALVRANLVDRQVEERAAD